MNKIAYVFPGQGSQTVGMLNAWAGHALVDAALAEASDALDLDLRQLIQEGPAARLNSTVNTQPAMVATSVAFYRAWQAAFSAVPAVAAGHSVGEFSALAAAGALTLGDAVRLVRARAQAMTEALPEGSGGMAAVIGLDDDVVRRLCTECAQGEVLEPVNYNAPGQVVVAGHLAAIERLKQPAKDAGARMVMALPVSGPFHSSLMQPAADRFRQAVQACPVAAPQFDVIQNATLAVATAATIADALVAHLTSPVRWTETIQAFAARGITHVVEIGPGAVLTNLTKRIAPELKAVAVSTPAGLEAAVGVVGA